MPKGRDWRGALGGSGVGSEARFSYSVSARVMCRRHNTAIAAMYP